MQKFGFDAAEMLEVVATSRLYMDAATRLGIGKQTLRRRLDEVWKVAGCTAYPERTAEMLNLPARVGPWLDAL